MLRLDGDGGSCRRRPRRRCRDWQGHGVRQDRGRLAAEPGRDPFQHGLRRFSLLLVIVAGVLTTTIFGVNLVLQRPFLESLLFPLAIAVESLHNCCRRSCRPRWQPDRACSPAGRSRSNGSYALRTSGTSMCCSQTRPALSSGPGGLHTRGGGERRQRSDHPACLLASEAPVPGYPRARAAWTRRVPGHGGCSPGAERLPAGAVPAVRPSPTARVCCCPGRHRKPDLDH